MEKYMTRMGSESSTPRSPSLCKSPVPDSPAPIYSPGQPYDRETHFITLSPVSSDITRILYSADPQPTGPSMARRESTFSPKGVLQKFLYTLPNLTLMEVLKEKTRRPVALSDYKHYLQAVEHGSEILEFYLAVEQLRQEENALALQYLISQIVEKFVRAGSQLEINIDHVLRRRILGLQVLEPHNPKELNVAQLHCFELMRTGSFPRFLHKTTYSNIGKAEVAQKLNMAIMSFLCCVVMIPVALTQPWFGRNFRICLSVPIFLTLSGLVEYLLGFCSLYAFLGARSLKSFNFYGLIPSKHTPPEKVAHSCVRRAQRRKAVIVWTCLLWPLTLGITAIIWAIPINI